LNLALLSDYEALESSTFSDEEKKVIHRYIPWSRKIVPGYTDHGKKKVKLENFICINKDQLVIKPSGGRGGAGVYIGQHTPQPKWEELLETAVHQGNWLVQEFVSSLPLLYQDGEVGCEVHNVVWGFLVLGSQYGGTVIRVLPQKHDKGVINYHQGAKVGVLFEVNQ
jgi:glutathione synthase/RimK-type ligase-like ATP-grasp enzyme